MLRADGLSDEAAIQGALGLEMRILRQAAGRLVEEIDEGADLEQAARLLQALGLAWMRLAKLIQTEQALGNIKPRLTSEIIYRRLGEIWAEEEDKHQAVQRWAAEMWSW